MGRYKITWRKAKKEEKEEPQYNYEHAEYDDLKAAEKRAERLNNEWHGAIMHRVIDTEKED